MENWSAVFVDGPAVRKCHDDSGLVLDPVQNTFKKFRFAEIVRLGNPDPVATCDPDGFVPLLEDRA